MMVGRARLFVLAAVAAACLASSASIARTPYDAEGALSSACASFVAGAYPDLARRLEESRWTGDGEAPRIVVLDPGHGGHDSGAVFDDLREKDLALALAQELRRELHAPGRLHVFLTREDDRMISLAERPEIAGRRGADLMISIHMDALPNRPDVGGAMVYLSSAKAAKDPGLEALLRNAEEASASPCTAEEHKAIAERVRSPIRVKTRGAAHRIVKHLGSAAALVRPVRNAGFRVLRTDEVPALLIDFGFLTNASDRARVRAKASRASMVRGVAEAVRLELGVR